MVVDKLYRFGALLLTVICVVTGQIVVPGNCPKYPTQSPFNPAQFISARIWYVISRYPSAFEENTKCSWLEVKPSKVGALKFTFNGIGLQDGAQKTAAGSGFFDYGDLSKFLIQVPVSSWNTNNELHWWILSTDYVNYALAWSCDPVCSGFRREQLWLLGRQRTINPDVMQKITTNFLNGTYFKNDYMIPVEHTSCPVVS